MPNVKVYADEAVLCTERDAFSAILPKLRAVIMSVFSAPQAVCHLTILPTIGLADQADVLIDVHYLSMPERSGALAQSGAERIRTLFLEEIGHRPDVRMISLAPEIYVALR